MNLFYKLNDDHTFSPCDVFEWATQFEAMRKTGEHLVGFTEINDCKISTVWMGHNLIPYHEMPLLLETMIFDSPVPYCDRYATWDEAVEGHKRAILWVCEGCIDENIF